MTYKMARRSFLRGCGAAALLAPLLRSMEARAQGLVAPRRLLILHHPLGSPLDRWRPTDAATTTTFTLPPNTAPFAPLQSKMVLVDGLNLVSVTVGGSISGQNTAEGGMVTLMTGVPLLGKIGQQDHCAGGPSIDQMLLDRSPLLGGAMSASPTRTPFGSLQLAADVRSDRDEIAPRVLSYRPSIANPDLGLARQPLYPETQPLNAFIRLFGGGLPPGTDASATLAQEISVLDFMRSDLARLRSLAPASERSHMDAHAAAIQTLEATIRQRLPAAVCATPAPPPNFPTRTGRMMLGTSATVYTTLPGVDYYDPADPNNHPHQALGQAHLALIKAAFLCDLTRVATFSWASGSSWVNFPTTFDGATLTGVSAPAIPHDPPLSLDPSTRPDATAWWTAIDRFYSAQSSLAIQALAAATDVDGNNLLDNTTVVYVTEQSRRWDHDQRNMPLLVFGGKNTRLKGGTFLKVTDGPLPTQLAVGATGNRPFNDFWLALAPSFGVDLGTLGANNQYTGALPGLLA
jgi:Protein of unknown function (DUF1552)